MKVNVINGAQSVVVGAKNLINNNQSKNRLNGVDYSFVDEFIKNDFSKSEIAAASVDGELTQEMINQMILQRLPKTVKVAKMFALEHPEFSEEDLIQDLIMHLVHLANNYKGQIDGEYNHYFLINEKRFLNSLLNSKSHDAQDYLTDENVQIPSNYNDCYDYSWRSLKENKIEEFLNKLPAREKLILVKHSGVNGEKHHTLCELSDEFQVCRERIRSLHIKALRRLHKSQECRDFRRDVRDIENGDCFDKVAYLMDNDMLSK